MFAYSQIKLQSTVISSDWSSFRVNYFVCIQSKHLNIVLNIVLGATLDLYYCTNYQNSLLFDCNGGNRVSWWWRRTIVLLYARLSWYFRIFHSLCLTNYVQTSSKTFRRHWYIMIRRSCFFSGLPIGWSSVWFYLCLWWFLWTLWSKYVVC